MAAQARKASFSFYKYQYELGHFNPTDAFNNFDAMIKSILCFASEIWVYQNYEIIINVHVQTTM